MKFYYLLIFLIVVVSLILIFYFSHKQTGTEKKLTEEFCNEVIFEPLNDICHIAFSKDINSCEDVEKGYDILCYEIVVNNLDVSETVCETIKSNYGKFVCNSRLAIELKDPEFCGSFNCYRELAVLTKDYDVCNYIESDWEKYKCLAKASGDKKYCKNINDEIERKSCEGLMPENVDDCKLGWYYNYDCLLELAYQQNNASICEMIDLEELKWTCIINVENNPEVCNNAPSFFEDLCRIEYLKNNLMIK